MRQYPKNRRQLGPDCERVESRSLLTLIVVLNGNSFHAAQPNVLTANAAAILRRSGNTVVQLANPAITSAGSVAALAGQVAWRAHGQAVGLVGFSAGGALALRIAADPRVHASAVLDDYGVPDIRAYLDRHAADGFVRPIAGLAPFRPAVVATLSGPLRTSTHVVAAFGQSDPHVVAGPSAADLQTDDPAADVYIYPGGHGAAITASPAALDDFLAHL